MEQIRYDNIPVRRELVEVIRRKRIETGKAQKRIVNDLLESAMRRRGWIAGKDEDDSDEQPDA